VTDHRAAGSSAPRTDHYELTTLRASLGDGTCHRFAESVVLETLVLSVLNHDARPVVPSQTR
jgi:hypothetical protein